jgi:altronate hydrolase
MKFIRIHPADDVAVAVEDAAAGEDVLGLVATKETIKRGHKVALKAMRAGEDVIKYGCPIGRATKDIAPGEWVHTHNLVTNLDRNASYQFHGETPYSPEKSDLSFMGYRRADGSVGIRNEIWVIVTVGCVNHAARRIAEEANRRFAGRGVDGVYALTHPYGCSQCGEDQLTTQKMLAALARHPNAAGALVLSLGCENNNLDEFKKVLGPIDERRVKFLVAQDVEDEIWEGVRLIGELAEYAGAFRREPVNIRELKVGLKCGGSDGLSGITANPLVGAVADRLTGAGASAMLTEVPEMFGAETLLMDRAMSREVFDGTVRLIEDFKEYFARNGRPVYENPSLGNKEGGITTLEEKSLGCVQKGGTSAVTGVYGMGERVCAPGLSLVNGPGNDLVAVTALAAAGAHLILFTTGRGTPLGSPVPVVKIATNTALARRKPGWIDFDTGRLLAGEAMDALADELHAAVLETAGGRKTKSEANGCRDMALFKNGVTQ